MRRVWAVALASLLASCGSAGGGNGAAEIERLDGNPLVARFPEGEALYARNPWDLTAFDGRLYVGAGNSSNWGPAPNAGPVPVVSFDPATGRFERELEVDDEQIDRFVVDGSTLWIPGHDPRSSLERGNLYRRDAGDAWQTLETVPGAVHVYDLLPRAGQLFAGLASLRNGVVARSLDEGRTWEERRAPGLRIHGLLEVRGELYAAGVFAQSLGPVGYLSMSRWSGAELGFQDTPHLTAEVVFPDTPLVAELLVRVVRPVRFGESALYIGGLAHDDHQYIPVGAYVAHDLAPSTVDVRRLPLADGARVWDLDVRDGRAFALVSEKDPAGDYAITILGSRDLEAWQEVARFHATTFARSFARVDGTWYVGLGTEVADPRDWHVDELSPDTGTILRVR